MFELIQLHVRAFFKALIPPKPRFKKPVITTMEDRNKLKKSNDAGVFLEFVGWIFVFIVLYWLGWVIVNNA